VADQATFRERQLLAWIGTVIVERYLRALPGTVDVVNVEDNPDYQRRDVDLLWRVMEGDAVRERRIEVKVDRYIAPDDTTPSTFARRDTGHFALETVSNDGRGSPGCFLYTTAHDLYYYYLAVSNSPVEVLRYREDGDVAGLLERLKVVRDVLYVLPVQPARDWFLRHKDEFADWETGTMGERGESGQPLYRTQGKKVPRQRVMAEVPGVQELPDLFRQVMQPETREAPAPAAVREAPADYTTDYTVSSWPGEVFFEHERAVLIHGDCLDVLTALPAGSVPMIFADPPYGLSNDGTTCRSGQRVSVNKGAWDRSRGAVEDHRFHRAWLAACQRVLSPHGTIWVSGTQHAIYSVGFAMQELGYKILNDIVWFKPNAPPNLACRYFTHSHETILWAARDEGSKHVFNYALIKGLNDDKQMRSLWELPTPPPSEKTQGKHPTQKPLDLLERIVLASTSPDDRVLDPFAGSGSTGVAALRLNRRFVGIEREDSYLTLARRRLEDELNGVRDPAAEERLKRYREAWRAAEGRK
jgi:site-specific DNA-methyltransferase (adenine-specific)